MRLAVCLLTMAMPVLAQKAAIKPVVARATMAGMEKGLDKRIGRAAALDSFDLLGNARGVYLDNYGAVFSAELSLSVGPWISPFRPSLRPEEIKQLHEKKLARLPVLRDIMREWLVSAAASLDTVPANEQVVLAVTLSYRPFEIREGLPDQIVMQAPRQVLLDIFAKKTPAQEIRSQEY